MFGTMMDCCAGRFTAFCHTRLRASQIIAIPYLEKTSGVFFVMLPVRAQNKIVEEIELFIDYAVAEEGRERAKTLVRKYRNSNVGLSMLNEFYRVLPEVRDEPVERILSLESLQGVMLFVLSTENYAYTTVISENKVHILGEYLQEELPNELLNYFGYANNDAFLKSCKPVEDLVEYEAAADDFVCPACQVEVGENHLLGCPVEVCPWCGGQLSSCNCRFEKLGVEELEAEEQLEEFYSRLEEKGRIPFRKDQGPSYPGTSEGLDMKKGS